MPAQHHLLQLGRVVNGTALLPVSLHPTLHEVRQRPTEGRKEKDRGARPQPDTSRKGRARLNLRVYSSCVK